MLSADRQRIILDQLYEKGSVKVSELSQELGVHEETIRRDLKALAQKWDIDIVYGGAILKTPDYHPSGAGDQHADQAQQKLRRKNSW